MKKKIVILECCDIKLIVFKIYFYNINCDNYLFYY